MDLRRKGKVESMTGKDLFREVGNINEKYVLEAEETKQSLIHNVDFRRSLTTAACLVICVGLFFVAVRPLRTQEEAANVSDIVNSLLKDISNNAMTPSDLTINSVVSENKADGYKKAESATQNNYWEEGSAEEAASSTNSMCELGTFVVNQGQVQEGLECWEEFVQITKDEEPAFIEIIENKEDGGKVETNVVYDGYIYLVSSKYTEALDGNKKEVWGEYGYLTCIEREDVVEIIFSRDEIENIQDEYVADIEKGEFSLLQYRVKE